MSDVSAEIPAVCAAFCSLRSIKKVKPPQVAAWATANANPKTNTKSKLFRQSITLKQ